MADDSQEAVTEGGTEAPSSSPDENQAAPEPAVKVDSDVEAVAETQEETTTTDEGEKPSKRAESRQHELAQKLKDKSEEADSLRSQLETFKTGDSKESQNQQQVGQQTVGSSNLPWESTPSTEGREITPEEYERDVLAKADAIVNTRLSAYQQNQARVNRFENDLSNLESTYPELKEDAKLSAEIADVYKKASAGNLDVRLKDIAEPILKARSHGKEEGKGEAAQTLKSQKAQEAVTPTASTGKRVTSEEELAEALKTGKLTAAEAEALLPKG